MFEYQFGYQSFYSLKSLPFSIFADINIIDLLNLGLESTF